jgi:hypothetical protein
MRSLQIADGHGNICPRGGLSQNGANHNFERLVRRPPVLWAVSGRETAVDF